MSIDKNILARYSLHMLTRKQLRSLRDARLGEAPNKLRLAMSLRGVTQEQLGEAIGRPQVYISKVVNGAYVQLPIENARLFAAYFGCHIEDLFPAREAVAS